MGAVAAPVYPAVQVFQLFVEVLFLERIPRHTIDPGRRVPLKSPEALLQKIKSDVMQQRRELCLLIPSRRLAHGCQPIRRGAPAQCPGRGRPAAVSLGRGPLLRSLRQEQAPFVRPLLSSYCLVRLLIRVHVHLRASAFMNRPGSPPGADEISQVPYKRCHHMHGVYDCARPVSHKPIA